MCEQGVELAGDLDFVSPKKRKRRCDDMLLVQINYVIPEFSARYRDAPRVRLRLGLVGKG